MRRSSCAACSGKLTDFLDLGPSPLADKFPADAQEPEHWYPLKVAVCPACWLVQLRDVVPGEELYGPDYGFRTGRSPAAVKYFSRLAGDLLDRYPDTAGKLVTEIACNDGTLLANFADYGCRTLGVEPSGAANDAREAGLNVVKAPFTRDIAGKLAYDHGLSALVLAFNVAAHVADPRDFLTGIHDLLADDGIAVIEFQDVAALLAGCQYDHVYHEHRFFYSLGSFGRIARDCGLSISGWDRSPAQGGSVRVYLRSVEDDPPVLVPVSPWLESMAVYEGMQDRARYSRTRLLSLIGDELNEQRVIAGYGATAKSATLLNFCRLLGPHNVAWIEDTTPGKIGRVTPGTHIPVCAPGRRPDTYLLTAWNYAGAMIRNEAKFLAGGGRIIVPGAVPVIL